MLSGAMVEPPDIWFQLARVPGLHAAPLRAWLDGLAARDALPPSLLHALTRIDQRDVDRDKESLRKLGAELLPLADSRYPPQLAAVVDAPVALYVRGNCAALCNPQLAMVGSRKPSPFGRAIASQFAQEFAQAGLTITSGLAVGIDAASHAGALAAKAPSVAVLGHGLARLYPPEHWQLAEELLACGGALLSEFPPDEPARKQHFPRRNRLISGLALGTLVIEAALASGSLITARRALDQGREVFALPGAVNNPLAVGCNHLIRQGATLVTRPADVLQELNIPFKNQTTKRSSALPQLDKPQKILLDAVGFDPLSIDALADQTGLPGSAVAANMMVLELEGLVGLHPGGRYARLPARG